MDKKFYEQLELAKKALQRQKLASHHIKLNKIDDIEDAVSRASYLIEEIDNALDEAREKRMFAADLIRFDFRDAVIEAEEMLDELLDGISDLGIDVPSEVQDFKSQLEDVKSEEGRVEGEIADMGFKV